MGEIAGYIIPVFFGLLVLDQVLRENRNLRKSSIHSRKASLRENTSVSYDNYEKPHSGYCVYHIRHSSHSMLMGYVGVSSNFTARKKQHLLHLKNKCHVNYKLQKAWDEGEFNEDSIQILASGLSRNEAYQKELSLRGRTNLGWNINKGGHS